MALSKDTREEYGTVNFLPLTELWQQQVAIALSSYGHLQTVDVSGHFRDTWLEFLGFDF